MNLIVEIEEEFQNIRRHSYTRILDSGNVWEAIEEIKPCLERLDSLAERLSQLEHPSLSDEDRNPGLSREGQ